MRSGHPDQLFQECHPLGEHCRVIKAELRGVELRGLAHAQEEEHPGTPALIEGEILGRQYRPLQQGRGVGPQRAADGLIQRLVVPDRRIALAETDLYLTAALRLDLPGQLTRPSRASWKVSS